jgi:hypothetical protein
MVARRAGRVTVLPACLALLALTTLVSLPAVSNANPAKASSVFISDSCSPKVNNIHWGTISGLASVKFVGQVECDYSTTGIELYTVLYFCAQQEPENNKSWLQDHCDSYINSTDYTPEKSGVTYKLSSPAPGETATRFGYYASELNYDISGSNHGPYFGTPAYCNGGSGGTACTNV